MPAPESEQPQRSERRRYSTGRSARKPVNLVTVGIFALAALGAVHLKYPSPSLAGAPFGAFLGEGVASARPSATAYGTSGQVKIRFAFPGEGVEYPLEVDGDPGNLHYSWVRVGDTSFVGDLVPLSGSEVEAPELAGFYHLALVSGEEQQVLDQLSIAVMVPFREKVGAVLNGYRLGNYISERFAGRATPEGFLEVTPGDLKMHVTKHLRVADFVSHDGQHTWPKYVAVSPRLLDKIELVVAEVARWQGRDSMMVLIDVKSGFRSPDHNRRIAHAASDSRHQYGDAADIAIDADGDGRLTAADTRLVALAVEIIERRHPELAGGLGMYTGTRTPYVHIDARGSRVRWRG